MCFLFRKRKEKDEQNDKFNEFKKISIRGRMAYAICCLENAMQKYNVNGRGWNWVLEKLWVFTSTPSRISLENSSCDLFPLEEWASIIGFMPNVEFFYKPYRFEDLCEYQNIYNESNITLDEYNMLCDAYRTGNGVIAEICNMVVLVGTSDVWTTPDRVSKDTLIGLQKLIDYMEENGIALPDITPFKQYDYSPEGIDDDYNHGWGYTFDGKIYSKFIN